VTDKPEFFSDSFWEEVSELDELGKRAYTNYLSARDALFACYGASDAPHLQELWRGYCESARLLDLTLNETRRFVGTDTDGSRLWPCSREDSGRG
jgi:hypothetical protein